MVDLQSEREVRNFNCTQQDLAGVAELGIQSYKQYQDRFYQKSEKYTPQWGIDLLNEMHEARGMPEYSVRNAMHKELRIDTINQMAACCVLWKELEGHIFSAYPKEQQEAKCQSAGSAHYRRASKKDWEQVIALMTGGITYINKHLAELRQAGMPESFPATFSTALNDFETAYKKFKNMEQHTEVLCDEKLRAYNAVHAKLMKMFKFGQKIFRYEAAIRERFTFTKVLEHVRQERSK